MAHTCVFSMIGIATAIAVALRSISFGLIGVVALMKAQRKDVPAVVHALMRRAAPQGAPTSGEPPR